MSNDTEPSGASRELGGGTRPAFYPPRAGGPGVFTGLWDGLRRQWHLETLRLPASPGLGARLAGLVVPGYAFCLYGRRILGWGMMALYAVAAGCFLAWLGHVAASFALGLMMSLHAVSLLYVARHRPALPSLRWQVFQAWGIVLVVSGLVYPSLRRHLEQHWFMPVTVRNQVVIVDVRPSARHIERGDWITFRYEAVRRGFVHAESGFGMGVVEGVAGDQVIFGREEYTIAGVRNPRRWMMPQSGQWQVPENHWFVWPDSSMNISGNAANVTPMLPDLALVPESQLVGKPFRRWFGREQVRP